MTDLSFIGFLLIAFTITANCLPDRSDVTASENQDSHHEDMSSSGSSDNHEAADTKSESIEKGGHPGSHAHLGGHKHGKSVDGSCVKPHPKPVKIFSKFAKIMLSHRMFILSSSKHYADQASLVLSGKPISENDPSKACLRVMWENRRRSLHGFGAKSVQLCTSEEITDINCTKREAAGSLQITYVWTDGRAHILAIMCGNGNGSWAILSNQRTIDINTKEAILQMVKSYGFIPDDAVDFTFFESDCAAAVHDDIQEGPCVETDDELDTIPADQKQSTLELMEKGVYTPFSSLANVYATGMFIRGTQLKGNEDLDGVCVRDVWESSGRIERSGFGSQKSSLECNIMDFTRITCIPEEKSGNDTTTYVFYKHIHPVWTDGKKYILTYNCLSTRLKTWSLFSTSKDQIDHDTKEYVLAKIANYGFDPMKAHESSYQNCKV